MPVTVGRRELIAALGSGLAPCGREQQHVRRVQFRNCSIA
jgi:hypothetical protein